MPRPMMVLAGERRIPAVVPDPRAERRQGVALNTGSGDRLGTTPPLPTSVGYGAGEVMDTPRQKGDRRLELPFSFEVAA
jgi:hypothetical protein